MTDVLIIALVVCVLAAAAYFTLRRAKKGGGCCGERAAAEKKIRAKSGSYPCEWKLTIGAMSCVNCAARVQNALNRMDGVSAKVDFGTKTATVKCAEDVTADALRDAVTRAGYAVLNADRIR